MTAVNIFLFFLVLAAMMWAVRQGDEVGADRSEQDLQEMKIWEDSDFAERLAEKFKVTKSKK